MAGRIAYGVKDMAIAVREDDGEYGALLDAPGIIGFSVNLEADSEDLFADDRILASTITQRSSNGSFETGVIDLATRAALTGGESFTIGTGAEAVDYYIAPSAPDSPLLHLAALSRGVGTDGGTFVARVPAARVTSGGGVELGQQYAGGSFDFTAMDFDGAYFWFEQHHANLAAIPTTVPDELPEASAG